MTLGIQISRVKIFLAQFFPEFSGSRNRRWPSTKPYVVGRRMDTVFEEKMSWHSSPSEKKTAANGDLFAGAGPRCCYSPPLLSSPLCVSSSSWLICLISWMFLSFSLKNTSKGAPLSSCQRCAQRQRRWRYESSRKHEKVQPKLLLRSMDTVKACMEWLIVLCSDMPCGAHGPIFHSLLDGFRCQSAASSASTNNWSLF